MQVLRVEQEALSPDLLAITVGERAWEGHRKADRRALSCEYFVCSRSFAADCRL